jgi:uncharacterized protein
MLIVDTNVFVGACMGVGASARVVQLCLSGEQTAVMGSGLLAEYEDVLSRESLFEGCRLSPMQRQELFDIFLASCQWRKTYFTWRPNLRDEADNHVVELAVAAAATHVVTWNVRDFALMELRFPLLRFSTPPDFLKEISS